MARDSELYKTFNIAILRDSWVLEEIEKDAAEHQMPGHVNKLLALRITEYYKLIWDGIISAAMLSSIDTAEARGHHKANGSAPGRSQEAPPAQEGRTERGSVGLSGNAEDNADAALDFFEPLE